MLPLSEFYIVASKVGIGTAISALLGSVVHTATAVGKVAETADALAGIGLVKAQNMAEIVRYEDALTMLELKAEGQERADALRAKGLNVDDIELG